MPCLILFRHTQHPGDWQLISNWMASPVSGKTEWQHRLRLLLTVKIMVFLLVNSARLESLKENSIERALEGSLHRALSGAMVGETRTSDFG